MKAIDLRNDFVFSNGDSGRNMELEVNSHFMLRDDLLVSSVVVCPEPIAIGPPPIHPPIPAWTRLL